MQIIVFQGFTLETVYLESIYIACVTSKINALFCAIKPKMPAVLGGLFLTNPFSSAYMPSDLDEILFALQNSFKKMICTQCV